MGLSHSRATAQTQTTPGPKQSSDMGWVEQATGKLVVLNQG